MPVSRNTPGMGERAYAFAKACGIISKSFTGRKISRLLTVNRLSELDRMVFPGTSRDLPEKELLVDLEDRIINRAVASIISLVDGFRNVPELLSLLIRSYEYSDLKSALVLLMEGEKTAPAHTDIGHFQTVNFSAWPDVQAMLKGTEFVFLLDEKGNINQESGIFLQTALDRHYYSALWQSVFSLPAKDRYAAERILSKEISLRNAGWVLRLRTYYRMAADKVRLHLIDIPARVNVPGRLRPGKRSLAEEAIQCLEFPLDNRDAWDSWRWKEFLNTDSVDSRWQADPRHFQNAASQYLYRLARLYFRVRPFSLDPVFCFIKLKQFEEDILTSCAEGLGMGMPSGDIVSILGVES